MAKVEVSSAPERELGGKFEAKVERSCDGSIDSFTEWRDCLRSATECQAYQSIATQYPRALEYLEALSTAIAAQPVSTRQADALAALATLDAAIEGNVDDNLPQITCGEASVCGNDVAEKGEMCDTLDLNGGTCVFLGYSGGGLLDCTNCVSNSSLTVTGQSSSYGTGSDGDIQAGAPFLLTDNSDGTITDQNTGLMWEKKDTSGAGLHHLDEFFTWCEDSTPLDGACDNGVGLDGTVVSVFLHLATRLLDIDGKFLRHWGRSMDG